MKKKYRHYTPEEDDTIRDMWPDYASAAMLFEDRTTQSVRERGIKSLGLPMQGQKKLSTTERSKRHAEKLAQHISKFD